MQLKMKSSRLSFFVLLGFALLWATACAESESSNPNAEPPAEICDDGQDNNSNDLVDCQDPQCDGETGPGGHLCEPFGETICDDGFDNDGDGTVDCTVIPIAFSSYPNPGQAAGQSHVSITVTDPDPLPEGASLECKTARDPDIATTEWAPCDGTSGTSLNFSPVPMPNWEGKTATLLRVKFADDTVSNVASLNYYLHASLNSALKCSGKAADAAFFAKAAEKLPDTGVFAAEANHLANPFIKLDFNPPISSMFAVGEADGPLEALSLRRRYSLNADKNMLLVTRNYQSRLAADHRTDCYVGVFRIHATHDASDPNDNRNEPAPANLGDPTRSYKNFCDALVFNTAGAAACLTVTPGDPPTVDFASERPYWRWMEDPYNGSGNIDFFMWRKIAPKTYANFFSPKCWDPDASCTGGNSSVLYLPDRDLFF